MHKHQPIHLLKEASFKGLQEPLKQRYTIQVLLRSMRKIPINTEMSTTFHCPIIAHYYKVGFSDILPGLKSRCNREGGVLEIYQYDKD